MLKNKYYVYGDQSVQVPAHAHFGQEMMDRMIEHNEVPALINADTGETVSYMQLAQQTVDTALSLARLGVVRGDVVSICSEKRMEVIATVLGVFCSGATFAPMDITNGAAALLHRMEKVKPKIMFCSPSAYELHKESFATAGYIEKYIIYGDDNEIGGKLFQDGGLLYKDFLTETAKVEDFLPAPVEGWQDILFILFSSGTTGLPKGVPWTHLGFLVNSNSFNESFKMSTILNTREWYYSYGLMYTLICLRSGSTIIYSPRNQEIDCFKAIEKYKIKILQLTPASITEMTKSPNLKEYDLSSVEMIISSSIPIRAEQVIAIKKSLPKLKGVYQLYGMTEAGCVCNELCNGPKDGSAGTPSHGFILKASVYHNLTLMVGDGVVEDGSTLGLEELALKDSCRNTPLSDGDNFPGFARGYLGVENRDHLDSDGFFMTGDIGYYDEEHYFYVVNRIKELIKFNDFAVAPAELESLLLQHPAVREAGVVGAPHADWGEVPTGFVALRPGATAKAEELTEFVNSRITYRNRLAGGVRFVDKLPRGAGEKLDRNSLKLML